MDFWKDRTVLVTGAHGFTGSHLCRELLRDGAKVKALHKKDGDLENLSDIRNQLSLCEGDVLDFDGLLKHLEGVDFVFNPAAVVPVMDARKNPQRSMSVNGIGSFNVAYAAMKSGVKRMVHVSTCHVYGNLPESELPIRETATPRPGDLYAVSKYAAEIYLRPLIDEGFPVIITRAFAKYGPGQGPQYFIPRVITQLLNGKNPKLGSPKPSRDYSYVADVVKGYMLALERGKAGEIYHFSSENETCMGTVYDIIKKLLKISTEPSWNEETRPQDIMRLFGSSQKAREQLGWKPVISLEEGLKLTIDWWKSKMAKTNSAANRS